MTDASPQFVVVCGLYDAVSRAHHRMLAGHTDAKYAGVWGGTQFYAFPRDGGGWTLNVKTQAAPDLTFACVLEERQSTSGKPVLFGTYRGTRLYIVPQPRPRTPKDCLPDYELMIRIEDYDIRQDGPSAQGETNE